MARILIVEDDEQIREVIAKALAARGHAIELAADGQAALAAYRVQPADLVITDLFMPGLDGLALTRRLAAEFVGAKVIAISGGGVGDKDEMLEMAEQLGALRTLAKPFTLQQLLDLAEAVLNE